MALLVLPGSKAVPVPTERHTWLQHPTAKGSFKKRAMSDIVEARPRFEFVDCKSIGSGTQLSHHVYKVLLRDNDDGGGSIISPRSSLRMWIDREEVHGTTILSSPRLNITSSLTSGLEGSWPTQVRTPS